MTDRLVVIGGDAAGLSAATNARRMRPDLEIVVFERGDWISFSACGEPYYVSGDVDPIERLLVRSVEDFARAGIAVHKRHEVTAIDTAERTVTVRNHVEGRDETVGYEALMYATGASPRPVPIAGRDLSGVYEMHVLDDALVVRKAVEAGAKRAVVVGGGFVGVEMAEAFHAQGLATTIVSSGPTLLPGAFDMDFAERIDRAVRSLGITVVTGERVETLEGVDGRVTGVRVGQDTLPADVALLAVGVAPNAALAEASGIRLGETGAVQVDDRQRTSVRGVWAAGDCAEAHHRLSDRAVNLHLGTIANKTGRIAGLNIGGADERFPGVLGTAITRVLDVEISRTGLTEAKAREAGYEPVADTFDSTTRAGYWPVSEPMTVKGVADRRTRRLLGAQIVGGPTAGKRIDALAMAIWNGMTVDDLLNVDLSYAPPFSGAWDPVLVVGRKLAGALDA